CRSVKLIAGRSASIHQVAAQTLLPGTSRMDVRATPASASAARAATRAFGTVMVVIVGSLRAAARDARGLKVATVTSSADRPTRRGHRAVLGSLMVNAWLRR